MGRHERWEDLYRREFPRVYRAVAAVLRDNNSALDAVHEAFAEGLRRPPADNVNLAGWLFRVAVRHARRADRRYRRVLAAQIRLPARHEHDDFHTVLDRIEVDQLLRTLTERQRGIVVAQFYLGLNRDEIAHLFAIRPGTVAATLAQAKARMRMEATHAPSELS
jgi:RNA polymerase sigma factor (sigma-70 family)